MHSDISCAAFIKNHRMCFIKYGIFFISLLGLATTYVAVDQMAEFRTVLATSRWLHPVAQLAFCIMIATVGFYAWLAWNAYRYRPVEGVSDTELPNITVVVPAYNEGSLVQRTLRSLATGDYPVEKLQLIAVDDGSVDDTWQYIEKATQEFPGRITAIRQMKNGGKRRALYEGFTRATGQVFVTVDSDSIVDSDTLRNLVSPFVGDADCGAVAGNVRVLNREEIIPRMLDVSFVFSFEFVRSAQSVLRTVLCTPGALAAYRGDLVMNVLDEWLHQKFFGREANIGEDRALTNLVLRQGKSVLFQRNAVVYTNVPVRYRNLCKMLIRWGRSNVRESLKMGSFAFGNFRTHHRISARLLLLMQYLWCLLSPLVFLLVVSLAVLFPVQSVIIGIGGGALWSTVTAVFYLLRYRSSEALWTYAYGMFHFCALGWITTYSLLTAWRTGWLTRGLPGTPSPRRKRFKRMVPEPQLASVQK
jgi:hyaluronan synthase